MSSSSASGRSSGTSSRSRRTASRQTAKALSRSGGRPTRAQSLSKKPAPKKNAPKKPLRAPRPVRQLVRWLVRGPQKTPRKVLMAGGSVATLAALVIVPTRVDSQQVALSSCQEVVQSGAEISRAQVASLLAVPEGSRREAVRQVIDVPYCLLPTQQDNARASEDVGDKASEDVGEKASEKEPETVTSATATTIEREAYPLAFDPEAWVVVRYREGEYAGYDFVFKP